MKGSCLHCFSVAAESVDSEDGDRRELCRFPRSFRWKGPRSSTCLRWVEPRRLEAVLRDLELWRWETDVPKVKHAVKVLRQLTGSARAAADEVSAAQLQSEEGVAAIVTKLKEHFQPHMEAAMPKAFEQYMEKLAKQRSPCKTT